MLAGSSEMRQLLQEPEGQPSSPSMWALYQKELNDVEVFEARGGFFSYKIELPFFHLVDFFIHPDFRSGSYRGALFRQVIQIAEKEGCESILGQVDIRNLAASRKVSFWLKMGAEVFRAHQDLVYFVKRL